MNLQKSWRTFLKQPNKIDEEIGRSRQRGIYKFYCMLTYLLTHTEDHQRGLDVKILSR